MSPLMCGAQHPPFKNVQNVNYKHELTLALLGPYM